MKLNININKGLLLWCVSLVALVLIRVWQLLGMTDYATGFILSGSKALFIVTAVISALIVAFAAAFASFSAKGENSPSGFYLVHSICALTFGTAIGVDAMTCSYASTPSFIKTGCIIFGLLSAAFFVLFAFRSVIHFPLSAKFSVLPVIYFVVKSVTVFIKGSYHVVISENVVEVFVYVFVMLFLLEFARLVNGLGTKASLRKIVLFGTAASLVCICSAAADLSVAIFAPSRFHGDVYSAFMPLFAGIYIAATVFTRLSFSEKSERKMGIYYAGRH